QGRIQRQRFGELRARQCAIFPLGPDYSKREVNLGIVGTYRSGGPKIDQRLILAVQFQAHQTQLKIGIRHVRLEASSYFQVMIGRADEIFFVQETPHVEIRKEVFWVLTQQLLQHSDGRFPQASMGDFNGVVVESE